MIKIKVFDFESKVNSFLETLEESQFIDCKVSMVSDAIGSTPKSYLVIYRTKEADG